MRMPDDIEKCPACGRRGVYNHLLGFGTCPYLDCATGEMQLCWDRDHNLWMDTIWLVVDENGNVDAVYGDDRYSYCQI